MTVSRKPRILGLIPAKGGSTRLPGKNIRPLAGKPLIAWAGEALAKSGLCDRIVVSTDDAEIAEVARLHGMDVPFMRPEKLARDPAGVSDVGLHCLDELRKQGDVYDIIIITLATSPFRMAEDVRAAYDIYQARGAKFLMSISAFDHTPFAAMKFEHDVITPWFPEYLGRQSTELPTAYRPNGAVHIMDVAAYEAAQSYFGSPLYAYEMPWPRSIDIDTPADFAMAEAVLRTGGTL